MSIFALIDPKTNSALAFYHDGMDIAIPAGCVQISEEDWKSYCEVQGLKSFSVDGKLLDEPPLAPPVTMETLQGQQRHLLSEVRDKIDEATDLDQDTAPLVAYRKAVRLALDNVTDPSTVVWPTKPWS